MRISLFGIPNCDSCKKARKWLDSNNIEYRFHDVRADGLTKKEIGRWLESVAWTQLLNTRSTTWRQLSQDARDATNEKNVVKLLVDYPTLVKRPVLECDGTASVGFSEKAYSDRLL